MSVPLPPLLKAAKKELERMGYTVTNTVDNGRRVDHSGSAIRVTEPASDTPPPRRALKAPDEDAPVTGREDW